MRGEGGEQRSIKKTKEFSWAVQEKLMRIFHRSVFDLGISKECHTILFHRISKGE